MALGIVRQSYSSKIMMREKVLIVLNEREPAKKEAAERLMHALERAGITASRTGPEAHLVEIIRSRRPKAVVLDYLIGEVTTGLDVMAELSKLPERPAVYFLTDEPSVSVAVGALGAGARGYFELDKVSSLPRLVEAISLVVEDGPSAPARRPRLPRSLSDLVLSSPAARGLEAKLRRVLLEARPLSVVSGPIGSGRTAVALALLGELGCARQRLEVDLRSFTGRAEDLFEPLFSSGAAPRAVIVENAEEDDGRVITCAVDAVKALGAPLYVVFVTREPLTRPWEMAGAEILEIPPLSERREDIPALAKAFWREAEELSGERLGPLHEERLELLRSLDYPAHVRQLRSMVIESAVESRMGFEESIAASHSRWENEIARAAGPVAIDRDGAARALHLAGMDYRIAAARLGCSVRELYGVVMDGKAGGFP